MMQKHQKRILRVFITILFYRADFRADNADPRNKTDEVMAFIRSIPWYMRMACHFFLIVLEYGYPLWAREFKSFSRAMRPEVQRAYLHFWCRHPFYAGKVLFKIVFAVSALLTLSRGDGWGYGQDLRKKLTYDQTCQGNTG